MIILVLSDSHGAIAPMERAVEQTDPHLILHLGDCWRDGERLHDRFPEIPLEQVPGNCDFRPQIPAERLLEVRGKRILMCHGHTYGVKQSLVTAGFAAETPCFCGGKITAEASGLPLSTVVYYVTSVALEGYRPP